MFPTDEPMQPVVETRLALDWLSSHGSDRQLGTSIATMGRRVREIAPDCLALSLGLVEDDLTFTFVAETAEVAVLDAVQYLDGGPCAEAAETGAPTEGASSPTDESRWQLFARGQGFVGVASTLSLPIMDAEKVLGGVNLYASTLDAFDGRHEELAEACGAWARGVVTNADLSFSSRLRAAAAPARLREQAFVDAATGFIAAHQGVDMLTAAARIRDAASRAGVREHDVAKFILDSNPQVGV